MGTKANVGFNMFPKQGNLLGGRVKVCFAHDAANVVGGECVRDDYEEPWETIFKLDDGRYVRSVECQYSY